MAHPDASAGKKGKQRQDSPLKRTGSITQSTMSDDTPVPVVATVSALLAESEHGSDRVQLKTTEKLVIISRGNTTSVARGGQEIVHGMASVQSHADGFEANQAFQVAINITNTKEVNLNVGDSFTHNESINMRSMSKPLTTIKYRGELEYNDMTIDSANGINVSEHMEYRALTVKNMEKNSTFHLKNRLVLSNTARVVNLKDGSGNKKIYEAQIASKNKEPTLILCSWDEPLNAPVGKLVEGYYLTCKLWKRSLEFQVNQFSSLFAYDQEPTNFGSQSSSSSSSTSTGAGINISLVVMNVEVPTEELYCGVVPVELPVTYSDLDNAIELVLSNVPDCKVVCIMETMADSEEFVITEENCTAAIDLNSRLKVMVTKPTPVPQPDMILESGLIIGVQVVNPTGDFLLEKIEWVVLEKGMTYDQARAKLNNQYGGDFDIYTNTTPPELVTDLTFLNGHNKAKFILSTNEQLEIAAAAVDDENAAVAMDEDQTASASEA